MSDVQLLKSSVNHRLTVAAEEEMILLKEEKERQEKLLDSVFNPELQRADVHELKVKEEEVLPEQQERSSSLKQENPAEPAHIKEEQEEVWINQEREQLQEPKEDEIITLTFCPVSIKSENDDEKKPQSLQFNENQTEENRDTEHLKAEADGEDCGGSETDRDFNPNSHLQPVSPDKTSDLSGSDTDDSADWEESDEPQEGSNPLQNKDGAVGDQKCNTEDTSDSSSEFASNSSKNKMQQKLNTVRTGERPFSCSVCGKKFSGKRNLREHMYRHSSVKPHSCSFCAKSFNKKELMVRHMRIHTGERPFTCSVCGKGFSHDANLKRHSVVHTGEKPFSCSVCGQTFTQSAGLKRHVAVTSCRYREKWYSCSICGQSFFQKQCLNQHVIIHVQGKPFTCSVCGEGFTLRENLKKHLIVHSGEEL